MFTEDWWLQKRLEDVGDGPKPLLRNELAPAGGGEGGGRPAPLHSHALGSEGRCAPLSRDCKEIARPQPPGAPTGAGHGTRRAASDTIGWSWVPLSRRLGAAGSYFGLGATGVGIAERHEAWGW